MLSVWLLMSLPVLLISVMTPFTECICGASSQSRVCAGASRLDPAASLESWCCSRGRGPESWDVVSYCIHGLHDARDAAPETLRHVHRWVMHANGVFGLKARYIFIYKRIQIAILFNRLKTATLIAVSLTCSVHVWLRRVVTSLKAEGAGLLYSDEELLVEHRVGRVRRKVKAVEAGVSPETDQTSFTYYVWLMQRYD